MSSMLLATTIFFGLTCLAALGVARLAWINRQRFQVNELVSNELQVIIEAAQQTLQAQKETPIGSTDRGVLDLRDPVMLSTLVTVLVNMHGTIRIKMSDFDAIPEGEFVSVYVDTVANELILSLDHDLVEKRNQGSILGNFTGGDDTTFH